MKKTIAAFLFLLFALSPLLANAQSQIELEDATRCENKVILQACDAHGEYVRVSENSLITTSNANGALVSAELLDDGARLYALPDNSLLLSVDDSTFLAVQDVEINLKNYEEIMDIKREYSVPDEILDSLKKQSVELEFSPQTGETIHLEPIHKLQRGVK